MLFEEFFALFESSDNHFQLAFALEQDRHLLKRKLETVRTEYDIRITELQADIRELSRSLTERESVLKQSEKEKAALITELTEQNDRLTSQLKEREEKCAMIETPVDLAVHSSPLPTHPSFLAVTLLDVAVTVTPFTVGQPHQDEKQNLSHFKQFEYLPLSCLFTPTENTAHKLAWSSEKVAAHPPDKKGDRENKERSHKGQQREHAGPAARL
uniref:Uncharacterized protein n=1 Tax=Timema douglasi TaxID=61478 RepID=A0A7R8VCP0_TIMDO|nr:unnamed protein product [Timema douglasi]